MWTELTTVLTIGAVVISAIFRMPPESAEKVTLALGGALGGYLAKSVINAITAPKPPEITQ